jgi:hypothetical protein
MTVTHYPIINSLVMTGTHPELMHHAKNYIPQDIAVVHVERLGKIENPGHLPRYVWLLEYTQTTAQTESSKF